MDSDIEQLKVAIVKSNFNLEVTEGLLHGAQIALKLPDYLADKNLTAEVYEVAGAFDIVFMAQRIALLEKDQVSSYNFSGILALGAVIKGESAHFEYISSASISALARINLTSNIPLSLGILTTYSFSQAIARAKTLEHTEFSPVGIEAWRSQNKGFEAMQALLKSIAISTKLTKKLGAS